MKHPKVTIAIPNNRGAGWKETKVYSNPPINYEIIECKRSNLLGDPSSDQMALIKERLLEVGIDIGLPNY